MTSQRSQDQMDKDDCGKRLLLEFQDALRYWFIEVGTDIKFLNFFRWQFGICVCIRLFRIWWHVENGKYDRAVREQTGRVN